MKEKEVLKQTIISKIREENIMGFIIDEIEDSLDYINKYKLKNILENIQGFVEDIKKVNESYINSL